MKTRSKPPVRPDQPIKGGNQPADQSLPKDLASDKTPNVKGMSLLAKWMHLAIALPQSRVRVRSRGNNLYVLCETPQTPDAASVISRLIKLLPTTDLQRLVPSDHPPIFQIVVYGRGLESSQDSKTQLEADWSEVIHLDQLDRYLEQLDRPPQEADSPAADPPPVTALPKPSTKPKVVPVTSSAIILSNQSQAKQGNADAIARYLSETLSTLGVGVEVTAKAIDYVGKTPEETEQRNRRLCIFCHSSYSPDPAVIAEPVARRLRELKLQDFRDALVFSQVSGEPKPDWVLRIDLTPPEDMLREWGRWGDVQAIADLLNQILKEQAIEVVLSQKEFTLHIFCHSLVAESAVAPRTVVRETIAPFLSQLAPQGLHAATIYGVTGKRGSDGKGKADESPAWVEWLSLPASDHPALADSAYTLGQQGDQPALLFLLQRLLNPDLQQRLSTGGIRIQLLRKNDLLHVMADAPVCPAQGQVGTTIAKFLRPMKIPGVKGVRVYGRRSGQKVPLWSYGLDFVARQRMVPEATPEFAASERYINDLLGQPGALALRSELEAEEEEFFGFSQSLQALAQQVQQWFLRTQIFAPSDQEAGQLGYPGVQTALVWGLAGLLLTFSSDLVLGQILRGRTEPKLVFTAPTLSSSPSPSPVQQDLTATPGGRSLKNLSLQKTKSDDPLAFNASGFTAKNSRGSVAGKMLTPTGGGSKALLAEPPQPSAAEFLAEIRRLYPSFNSQQLGEKLALYHRHLAEQGPPDILVIGSSRALRGVDPAALQKSLAEVGYPGLKVFNFGINGATAQVVDLVIRQMLTADQLPRMILWADGARAFNSGRVDITYNGILASEGFRRFQREGGFVLPGQNPPVAKNAETPAAKPAVATAATSAKNNQPFSLTPSFERVNDWLNQTLSSRSSAYQKRDQVKTLLRDQWIAIVPESKALSAVAANPAPIESTAPQPKAFAKSQTPSAPTLPETGQSALQGAIDFNGFMSLPVRFNPATYFQQFARVSGAYDSDYESFQLEGQQSEALAALIQVTQARRVPLVFVNLPLTQDYLDPVRSGYEQEFLTYMQQLASQQGLVFRDMGKMWPQENDFFSDPSHLNCYGAYAVSNYLAQDPLIPWPKPKTAAAPITKPQSN